MDMITENQIKHMVDRFLRWRLPADFRPDAGISFKPTFNDHLPKPSCHEPTGTNLFDATQATAMVRYIVEGLPDNSDAAIAAAEKFSDVIHAMEARGVNLTRAEDKAWENATAELERVRSNTSPAKMGATQ